MLSPPCPVLPPRPYRLRTSFVVRTKLRGILLSLLGAGALCAALVFAITEGGAVFQEQQLWNRGQPAAITKVDKHERQLLVSHRYHVDVEYRDAGGGVRRAYHNFETLLGSADTDRPLQVRYDPATPDSPALSWAVAASLWRYVACAFEVLVLAGVGALLLFTGLAFRRELWVARRCAEDSEEVVLDIVKERSAWLGPRGGASMQYYYYRLEGRPGEAPREGRVACDPNLDQRPLYADARKKRVIALVCAEAPNEPVLVQEDHYPFEIPPAGQKDSRLGQ